MNKKILLVDDEQEITELLSVLLRHHGYQVEIAHDGIEALGHVSLAITNHSPFDLILLDIQMPKMSGTEVLYSIRKEEEERGGNFSKGTPIVMITAHENAAVTSFKEGCDAFICKPFDHEELLAVINKEIG